MGNFWGANPRHLFDVNGKSYFSCIPSASGLYLQEYSTTLSEPIILPQWGYSAWLGRKSTPFWRVYSDRIYTTGAAVYDITTDEVKVDQVPIRNAVNVAIQIEAIEYDIDPKYYADLTSQVGNNNVSFSTDKLNQIQNASQNIPGFSIANLKEVYPNVVVQDPVSGTESINPTGLIPLLVRSIQELQSEIETLEQRIIELENQ